MVHSNFAPDNTAVRVALWRAMHVQVDAPPPVFTDELGLRFAAPDDRWRQRPDMDVEGTKPFRASIVGRARFVEDLIVEQVARGADQYVILGAGLDSFVQRWPEFATKLTVFEIDQPSHQAWKRQRLHELGYGVPDWLRLVPVDFEVGDDWWQRLVSAGFDAAQPAIVASSGVSMYLTRQAITETFRRMTLLAPGSIVVMTFLVPPELADPVIRPGLERAIQGARQSGTPFLSFFTPEEMMAIAREAGMRDVEHVASATLANRYFHGRLDGLRPPDRGEELLVARI